MTAQTAAQMETLRSLLLLEAENKAMRKLLQRVVDHFGEGAESPLAMDARALLASAPEPSNG